MADYNYGGEGTFSRLFARLKTLLGGYLRADQLQPAVDDALTQAKESGEFKGDKGDPFEYEDFTPEQLAALKGEKGDSGVFVKESAEDEPADTDRVMVDVREEEEIDIMIPDSLLREGDNVYLMCEDEKMGEPFVIKDGVGIKSVEQSTVSDEDDGVNVITITLTDGTVNTFEVKNGSGGSVTVDDAMSDVSANPVQNKVVKAYVDGLIGDVDTAIADINTILGGG